MMFPQSEVGFKPTLLLLLLLLLLLSAGEPRGCSVIK